MKDLDDRLRDAGAAWRDDYRTATEPDLGRITGGRRRVLLPLAAAVAVIALVVAGVLALRATQGDEQTAAGLVGPVWKLDGRGASTFVIGRDGQLVADDECVVIGGRVKITGTRLTVTDLSDRWKGCTDTYDPYFGKLFDRPVTVAVEGNHATLTGNGRTLRATKAPQFAAPTLDLPFLTDTTWRLASATPAGMPTDDLTGLARKATLEISDGRMRYDDTCTERDVSVTVSRDRVRPSGDDSGYACAGGTTLGAITAVLENPFSWRIAGNVLTLRAQGAALTYVWVPKFFPAVDPSRLVGPTWRLTSVAGEAATQQATVRFPTATTYEFTSACGILRGSAQISVGTLDLKGIGDDCRGQLSTVASFLSSSPAWRIADDRLVVGGGGSQALAVVFAGDVAGPVRSLEGSWKLDEIETANTGRSSDELTITFTGNTFTVSNTCVSGNGDYSATASSVRFGTFTGTGCRVQGFTDVVAGGRSASWQRNGDQLVLSRGRYTLTFSSSDGTTTPPALDGTWRLRSAEQGAGGSSSGAGSSRSGVIIEFAAGRYVIRGLCVVRMGSYTVAAGTLTANSGSEPLCLSGGLGRVLERTFTDTLNWSVREQILTLRKGSTTLTFTR